MGLYILGAGASAQDNAPTTSEVIDKAFDNFGGEFEGQGFDYLLGPWEKDIAVDKFKPVFELFDKFYGTGLAREVEILYEEGSVPAIHNVTSDMVEDFFTKLYRMQRGHEKYGYDLSDEEISTLNKNAGFFFFHTLCHETGFNSNPKHYLAFVENVLKINVPHCVITFNYDLLLEEALSKYMEYVDGQWIMLDNLNWTYGLPFKKIHNTMPNIFQDDTTSRIYYLKLHGSLNWGYCPVDKEVTLYSLIADPWLYTRFYNEEYRCHTDEHNSLPLLIPPIAQKEIEFPALRKVWDKARFFLSHAEEIHIIGYSLPDVDKEAQDLFRQALTDKLKRVVIANPSKEHTAKVRRFFSGRHNKFQEYTSFREYLKGEYGVSVA